MASVSATEGRRLYVPEIERENWRWMLFQHFRDSRRYQNIIAQDLRPLWRAVGYTDLPDVVKRFRKHALRARRPTAPAGLSDYVDALRQFVRETLQLTDDGEAARWACDYVHLDVEPKGDPSGCGFREPDPTERRTARAGAPFSAVLTELTITVNPAHARIEPAQSPVEAVTVAAGDFMRFDDWDELRREAHAVLDAQIDYIAATFHEWYPDMNPTTREKRAETCKLLARHYFSNFWPPAGAERERLRELARLIGADFAPPTAYRKTSSKTA